MRCGQRPRRRGAGLKGALGGWALVWGLAPYNLWVREGSPRARPPAPHAGSPPIHAQVRIIPWTNAHLRIGVGPLPPQPTAWRRRREAVQRGHAVTAATVDWPFEQADGPGSLVGVGAGAAGSGVVHAVGGEGGKERPTPCGRCLGVCGRTRPRTKSLCSAMHQALGGGARWPAEGSSAVRTPRQERKASWEGGVQATAGHGRVTPR